MHYILDVAVEATLLVAAFEDAAEDAAFEDAAFEEESVDDASQPANMIVAINIITASTRDRCFINFTSKYYLRKTAP